MRIFACVPYNISAERVTQTVLYSSFWRQHCCAVTLVTPKCFLSSIEVTWIHSNWTKLLSSWSNGWTHRHSETWKGRLGQCLQNAFMPIISVFELTLSGSISEHTPKLMQPSSTLTLSMQIIRQTDIKITDKATQVSYLTCFASSKSF